MAGKSSILLALVALAFLWCNVLSVPLPEKAEQTEKNPDSNQIRSELKTATHQQNPVNANNRPEPEKETKPNANGNPDPKKGVSIQSKPVTGTAQSGPSQSQPRMNADMNKNKDDMMKTMTAPGQVTTQSQPGMQPPKPNERGPVGGSGMMQSTGMKRPGTIKPAGMQGPGMLQTTGMQGPGMMEQKGMQGSGTKPSKGQPKGGTVGIQSIAEPDKGGMIIIGFEDDVLFTNTGEKIPLKLNVTKAKMVMADPKFLNKIRHFAPILLASSGPMSMEPKIVDGKIVIVNHNGPDSEGPLKKKVQVRIGDQMVKLNIQDFLNFMKKMNPRAMQNHTKGELTTNSYDPNKNKGMNNGMYNGMNNGKNNGMNNGMNNGYNKNQWGGMNKPTDKPKESQSNLDQLIDIAECFPASATVRTADGRTLRMDQLKENDNIISGANGATAHVFTFSHRDHVVRSQFYRLRTASGSEIVLSLGHYLPVNAEGRLTAAADVSVGDTLKLADGTLSPVISTDVTWETGLYNPHTTDGSIVVNGVVASTYTSSVKPVVARAMLSPVAAFFRMFGVNLLGSFLNGSCVELRSFVAHAFKSYY